MNRDNSDYWYDDNRYIYSRNIGPYMYTLKTCRYTDTDTHRYTQTHTHIHTHTHRVSDGVSRVLDEQEQDTWKICGWNW